MEQKFYPEDVGKPVTDILRDETGIIKVFRGDSASTMYPVVVKFDDDTTQTYTVDGKYENLEYHNRTLFHGHNIKVEISGEEISVRKVKRYLNVRVQKGEGLLASLWNRKVDAESIADPFKRYILIAHEVDVEIDLK